MTRRVRPFGRHGSSALGLWAAAGLALLLLVPVPRGTGSPLRPPAADLGGMARADPDRGAALGLAHGPEGYTARSASRVVPAVTHINPLAGYSHEPAPMGIADFGVTGTGPGASAYEYASPSFEGTASITALSVSTSGGRTGITAFELNAVLVLARGGTNYSYWIQNGLHVDPATREYTIGGAYVWNFSSPSAVMSASEVQGNKSSVLDSGVYIFIPGCGVFAGQCSTLAWPATLTGRINASLVGGIPVVSYQYDLGSGWVTYDRVSFLHLSGAVVTGFEVNGLKATPRAASAFYDAEWVWVGAGGGSSSLDLSSGLAMSLAFWNGHNFQEVPDAWDFGGDTGETAANVTESSEVVPPAGGLAADVTAGAGALGVLYNGSSVGALDVTTPPLAGGTVLVDGVPFPFDGSGANLTLAAGTYSVSLEAYSNATVPVTIVAGTTDDLDLTGAGRTAFEASGLPTGTNWSVTVGVSTDRGPARTLAFSLANGSYNVSYGAVPGFVRNASAPSGITVPVADPVLVAWTTFTFPVPVEETGLPEGTAWWVEAGGHLYRTNGSEIDVPAPNGTTAFETGSAYEFIASPSAGSIDVASGTFAPVPVTFSYRPTFLVGAVTPSDAQLTIDGVAQATPGGLYNASVVPGNYTLEATAAGYVPQTIPVEATPGNATVTSFVLVRSATPVTHNPSGTSNASGGGAPFPILYVVAPVVLIGGALGGYFVLRRRNVPR